MYTRSEQIVLEFEITSKFDIVKQILLSIIKNMIY